MKFYRISEYKCPSPLRGWRVEMVYRSWWLFSLFRKVVIKDYMTKPQADFLLQKLQEE